MEKLLALEATYADWKVVKTRGILQLVFELDLQNADRAYAVLGGMPNPAKDVWVAIARLNLNVRQATETPAENSPTTVQNHGGRSATRPPNPYAKRAGILCNDIRFQKFLADRYGIIAAPDAAACKVRELCEVASRAEIAPGTPAADRFDILESAYRVENQ